MKRIATALAALLLAAGISWGQDPDLTGFLEQLENVNGRMATAMNNDDKEGPILSVVRPLSPRVSALFGAVPYRMLSARAMNRGSSRAVFRSGSFMV